MKSITEIGSFAVKNDGSEEFKEILELINENRRRRGIYQPLDEDSWHYYGIVVDEKVVTSFGAPGNNIGGYYVPILSVSQVKELMSETKTTNMTDVIITGFSNPTKEGVVLHLNKKASLKTGNITNNEFWVSWDKIGDALFDGYTKLQEVSERNKLRSNSQIQ